MRTLRRRRTRQTTRRGLVATLFGGLQDSTNNYTQTTRIPGRANLIGASINLRAELSRAESLTRARY